MGTFGFSTHPTSKSDHLKATITIHTKHLLFTIIITQPILKIQLLRKRRSRRNNSFKRLNNMKKTSQCMRNIILINYLYRQQNKSIGRMLNIMDSYYSNMKQDMGIFEKNNFEEEDSKLDEVLKTLRPNTTAKNFKEYLSRQDNINRSTHWKSISRKLVA